MNDIAVRVERLGKKYLIGSEGTGRRQGYKTVRETLEEALTAPFRAIRDLAGKRTSPLIANGTEHIWALKDISFDVKWGEVLGIIGRNGAGKSTLLKILSRITEPTEGRAEIYGHVQALLEVGTGFHPELTGRENIYLNGAILGMKRTEIVRKFDAIVDFAEVGKFINTPVKHYSTGMHLRLAFAVAAHFDSEILIVDEVLAVGDAAFQKKCLGKMQDVTKAGRTVLFVSHNLGAIEALSSKVLWVDEGKIRKIGKPTQIVSEYLLESTVNGFKTSDAKSRIEQKFSIQKVLFKKVHGEPTTIFRPFEDVVIEIQFHAPQRVERPHIWVSVSSQYGPLFGADMTVDGHSPESLGAGDGILECRFKMPVLLPQTYTVRIGVREKNATMPLIKTVEVGAFRIEAAAKDYGLRGLQADISLMDASPLFVSYEWRLPSGKIVKVDSKKNE